MAHIFGVEKNQAEAAYDSPDDGEIILEADKPYGECTYDYIIIMVVSYGVDAGIIEYVVWVKVWKFEFFLLWLIFLCCCGFMA